MELEIIKKYLEKRIKLSFDKNIITRLKELREEAIDRNEEIVANEIWCLEKISDIQNSFIIAFDNIKNKKNYYSAWKSYNFIDINLYFLRKHFDYSFNEYNLEFIEEYSKKLQKLFPYEYFMSRESIVKKESCTICGEVNTIRKRCGHKIGELYMGKMCSRKVEEFEFLGIAIVKNPFDKYTVLFLDDKEYNYEQLDILFENLKTPYDNWDLKIEKKKKPEFKRKIGRNKDCPCGSSKKYKKCCLGTDKEMIEHKKIVLLDNPEANVVNKTIGTWKD